MSVTSSTAYCSSPDDYDMMRDSPSFRSTSPRSDVTSSQSNPVTYLTELRKEEYILEHMCSSMDFQHVRRLLQQEIDKARLQLLSGVSGGIAQPQLPEAVGDVVTIVKKLFIPKKQYPEFNFHGRILGPRGSTIKLLERETGCQLAIRGRGSNSKIRRSDEDAHVLVTAVDTQERAELKVHYAEQRILPLMVPVDDNDDLKAAQLNELGRDRSRERALSQSPLVDDVSRATGVPLQQFPFNYNYHYASNFAAPMYSRLFPLLPTFQQLPQHPFARLYAMHPSSQQQQ